MWLKFLLILELILVFALAFVISNAYLDKSAMRSFIIGLTWMLSWSVAISGFFSKKEPRNNEK